MPTVLRHGPYRFVFFSSDRGEPPHIHVTRDRLIAKFWLQPVSIERAGEFPAHELNRIRRLVEQYEDKLVEAWHDYFGA